jgi:hypothetical protein
MGWTQRIVRGEKGYVFASRDVLVDEVLKSTESDVQKLERYGSLTQADLDAVREFAAERELSRSERDRLEAELKEKYLLIPRWKWIAYVLTIVGVSATTAVTAIWGYAKASGEYALRQKLEHTVKEAEQHRDAIKKVADALDARLKSLNSDTLTVKRLTVAGAASGWTTTIDPDGVEVSNPDRQVRAIVSHDEHGAVMSVINGLEHFSRYFDITHEFVKPKK